MSAVFELMVDEIGKMIIDHMDRCYASGMLLQLWIWACILMHWSIYLMPEHCKIHLIPFICLVLLFCIFLFFFLFSLFFSISRSTSISVTHVFYLFAM